ncbi:LysM domain-containing protein [Nocardioides seonyuensis]|uniref:LysM domain-containing protein n=1 Tax=Nocardioides seonyuensis TaxID=2518371 RepID=A0A4P7IHG1_9ACTN|nr:LysM domain-containing protein [Nocardioides seonyuensis]QBX56735.1 LysM domain-containing protein [Nocardioides seonyuensis]
MSDDQARQQLAAVLSQAGASVSPFGPNSRYRHTPLATGVGADGTPVRYLRRRFLPDPDALVQVGEHKVEPGDRLDLVAAAAFSDPELSWRICDANLCLDPDELVSRPGRRLRITLPAGLPGGGA